MDLPRPNPTDTCELHEHNSLHLGLMRTGRRQFVKTMGLPPMGILGRASLGSPLERSPAFSQDVKIGICDWNLGPASDPEMIPTAKKAHLQGIQVSIGDRPDHLPLGQPAVRKSYLGLGQMHSTLFPSVPAGSIPNQIPLRSEPHCHFRTGRYRGGRGTGSQHRASCLSLNGPTSRLLGGPEQGEIDFGVVVTACWDIGYDGWFMLETGGREGHFLEGTRSNVSFARRRFSQPAQVFEQDQNWRLF